MDDMSKLERLQKQTGVALAIKTEGGKAIADTIATSVSASIEKLIVTAGKDEDLIQLLYEVRGAMKVLGAVGYDVRSVIDLASRNAVKQQMHLTKPPTIRRDDDERSTEGEAEDGQ